MFRILSIDGGGLRGIIPIKILKHVEYLTQKPIYNCFDMFAGTSTGGLISVGLTVSDNGISPRHDLSVLENIYMDKGNEIFPTPTFFHRWWRKQLLSYPFSPQFETNGLQKILEGLLFPVENNGETPRILDCCKPIFVPAYDLESNSPIFFKRRYAENDINRNVKLIDVCKATSAAPTFFPSYTFPYNFKVNNKMYNQATAIDGGVFMNNPALGALIELLKNKEHYYKRGQLKDEDIFILSLGTGHFTENMADKSASYGKLNWIKLITDIMMWGNSQAIDYNLTESLKFNSSSKLNYLRVNVEIKEKRYNDMANYDPKCIEHYLECVENDFTYNAAMQNSIDTFISDAKLYE